MAKAEKNPRVDAILAGAKRWQDEYTRLRKIALSCPLTEEVKWGSPCYAHEGRNIVLIHGFKAYCAYLFFKGALLRDEHGLLVRATENVQAPRQIRFTGSDDIKGKEEILKSYILQAIEVEKSGAELPPKRTENYEVPQELQDAFDAQPRLKAAFGALTPGRQRAYLLHFAAPKQAKTRVARIEKSTAKILAGKGLQDEAR